MRLNHHHIVVTGGTQGIGLGVARMCAESGALVTVTGRDIERGLTAQTQLKKGAMFNIGNATHPSNQTSNIFLKN